MSINEKILKEIKEKMRKEMMEKNGIIDMEKYLLEYVRKLDPIELANKCGGSLDEAIEAMEFIRKNSDFRKGFLMSG